MYICVCMSLNVCKQLEVPVNVLLFETILSTFSKQALQTYNVCLKIPLINVAYVLNCSSQCHAKVKTMVCIYSWNTKCLFSMRKRFTESFETMASAKLEVPVGVCLTEY